jgi:hypothetical protein
MTVAREMWLLFEPVHAVTYFVPEGRAAYEAAGLRGFWRGYFAGRAAPLGPVGAAPVVAAFSGFAPVMVERALPDVWSRATPAAALAARRDGAVAALSRVAAGMPAGDVADAAGLLERAVGAAEYAGRVLAAAHAALPRPDEPLARLWHACTVLREHRGDGHVAALVAAGLDGCEPLVWRAGIDVPRDVLQPNRGWTDGEWAAATERLVARGWLRPDGTVSDAGRVAHDAVEAATDVAAARPWAALTETDLDRLRTLLAPVAAACLGLMPERTPIGLPGR